MKSKLNIWILLSGMLITLITNAQVPEKAGRFVEDKFVLTIDLKWTDAQKKQLADLFDLDSLLMKAIFDKQFKQITDCTDWAPVMVEPGVLELSKPLKPNANKPGWSTDVFLLDENLSGKGSNILPEPADYGLNNFTRPGVFKIKDGKALFFLPDHTDANKVYLAGTFNQWSTLQNPMKKIDSGWIASIPIVPGKFLYKYIIDGEWQYDVNNKNRERDGHWGYNSVLFVYNHIFTLKGFQQAKKVILTGSFNSWRENELRMQKTAKGWDLPVFLREGTHAYKFIVDGEWMNDPTNKITRPDGTGQFNSFLGIGDTMIFKLAGYPQAKAVALAGSFNAWNSGEMFMEKTAYGWELPYVLGKGNYEYKFVVDGNWILDPGNPFTTGTGDKTNSLVAFGANHVFRVKGHEKASEVLVSGSFNNWSKDGYQMYKQGKDWVLPINLKPGRYTYKIVIDGKWMLDKGNPLWEGNEYGTGNSVIWVE
jgi:hypothetical protein